MYVFLVKVASQMKDKLRGLTQDLYQLACHAQNLEARLDRVRDTAAQVEYELNELAYTNGYEGDIEVGNLMLCFSGSSVRVVSADEYEKGL